MTHKPGYLDALARECLGAEVIDTMRDELDFPEPRFRSADAPEHILMILFASRTGSTYAGQLLSKTPHFTRVGEFFNIRQLRQTRERQGSADDGQALRWMIENFGSPHAFGVKCGIPGLAAAVVSGFLEATLPRTKILVLDRRDRVAQAVSLFRAQLTGRYQVSQNARITVTEAHYDRRRIAERLATIDRVYAKFDDFLGTMAKPYRRIWYEDLVENPKSFVDTTCDLLDLPRPDNFDPNVRATKLGDRINRRWIERYQAGE